MDKKDILIISAILLGVFAVVLLFNFFENDSFFCLYLGCPGSLALFYAAYVIWGGEPWWPGNDGESW